MQVLGVSSPYPKPVHIAVQADSLLPTTSVELQNSTNTILFLRLVLVEDQNLIINILYHKNRNIQNKYILSYIPISKERGVTTTFGKGYPVFFVVQNWWYRNSRISSSESWKHSLLYEVRVFAIISTSTSLTRFIVGSLFSSRVNIKHLSIHCTAFGYVIS